MALQRILNEDLLPLAPAVVIERTEQTVEIKASPQYGMPTTYLRTVHFASIEDSFLESLKLPVIPPTDQLDIPALSSILPRDVYGISDGRKVALYSWLRQAEFDLLQSPSNAE